MRKEEIVKRIYLMTPGPSPVPSSVRSSLAQEVIHHRTEEFREILSQVHEGLKYVFCTNNPVLVLASSGTGAMEAAVSNFLSSGQKVIVVNGGKFGERWKEIATGFGLEVIEYKIEWGSSPCPDRIKDLLDKNKDVRAVFTTLCETSTGTVYDIEAISKLIKDTEVILVVDAISGLGQDKLLTDEWSIDVVVGGSQKGFMLPPGLAFISINKKAESRMKESNLPKYYFDLNKALKSYHKSDTPYTPAVSLVVALNRALGIIKEEGLEERWTRFAKLACATRFGAHALGLKLFSKNPSNSVTAITSPSNIKSSELVKKLRKEYGLSIAGGQAEYKDKIFRIAHMGWINEQDLIMCFSLLEKTLVDLGYSVKLGASLQKIEEALYG
jgi:aspartate aminotransferase-like enzyme